MLEEFIRDYSDRAYQFAYQLCGDAEQAKELVQEAFYRIIRKWDQYDPSRSLEGWFLTILRNLYFDGLRSYERRNVLSLDVPSTCDGGEDGSLTLADAVTEDDDDLLGVLARDEDSRQIQAAFDSLKPEYRAVLTMCDGQGLSYEEIASVMDCPKGTVRSRLNRARAALRQALSERREVVQ